MKTPVTIISPKPSMRRAIGLWLPLSLALLIQVSGCGDSDSDSDSDSDTKSPTSSGDDGSFSSTPTPTPTDGADTGTATGNTDSADPGSDSGTTPPVSIGPLLADLGVVVGTRPGMVGAPFDAFSFPDREIVSVLALDAIPAITDPVMLNKESVDYITDNDFVFGVVINGDARAYPHNIGWWHEIVNDVVGGEPVVVTFCPLTGTGLVYDGVDVDGQRLTLGVSGLLYNTNLVMYNRNDQRSLYPQIFSTAVQGARQGHTLDLLPVVETTWGAWKQLYPSTRIMAKGTYRTSRYGQYPYGQYRTDNNQFLFAVKPTINSNPNPNSLALGTKDRVIGLRIDGEAMAFPFDDMESQQIIHEEVGGLNIAIAWDAATRMAIPYARRVGDQVLSFDIVEEGFPFSMRDRETGTLWDIRGLAIDGELAGERLVQIPSHNSMWFAWVTFWPNTDVWSP